MLLVMIIVAVWVVVIMIAKERGADPTKTQHNMEVFVSCIWVLANRLYIKTQFVDYCRSDYGVPYRRTPLAPSGECGRRWQC